ncbi:MAG: type II and III secretion system protein [Cytophagales bacterium]|nr:type II and III secretion system protein [Cytophagales bacterium]
MRYYLIILIFLAGSVAYGQKQDRIAKLDSTLTSLSTVVGGLNEQVDFTLNNAPIHELLRTMAEQHLLNINVHQLPNLNITNNFNYATVKDVLVFICREYDLEIQFVNNILTVRPYSFRKPKPIVIEYDKSRDQISFDLQMDTLASVVKAITVSTGNNVLTTPEVRNSLVSGFVASLDFNTAMEQFAVTNNLEMDRSDSGVVVFRQAEVVIPNNNPGNQQAQQPNNSRIRRNQGTANRRTRGNGPFTLKTIKEGTDTYLSLEAQSADVSEVLSAVAQELKVNYAVLEPIQGTLEGYFAKITFDQFLSFATETAGFTYGKKGDVYLIGSNQKTGLAEATVYRFKNRSVEGVDQMIPASLSAGLDIGLLPELNALLVTGGERDANMLVSFLEQIDEPVLNVLIEVIVTEVNKGSTLNTGVQAFLADSVPSTSGQVFGGVDLTLSSNSLNSIIANLDTKGVVNLGRVTPKFYATIQAMENNNDLNVRSTPKLSTMNGNEAELTIGQSVYFLIETQNVTGGINPIVTRSPRYEKVEANLEISILPFVSANEDITLSIEAEFSDFIDPTVEGAPPGNATRKFISKIRIRNEEMIVLGGLEEVSKSESGSGVPFLSRIPVLKWLFSSRSKSERNNRLVIFIKPTIVY